MPIRRTRGDGVSDSYMQAANAYKRIDTDEENRLAELVHNGTEEERRQALETLVCSNLRLVVKIAHDFKKYGLPFADLVSEGNLGLMTAAERFEAGHGAKFSCYAAWWIKQAMRRAIAMQAAIIRVPQGSMQHLLNMYKARGKFVTEYMREPTQEELKGILGYSDVTLANLTTINNETVSLSEQIDTESEATYEDVLSEQPQESQQEGMRDKLRAALQKCTPLERRLVSGYFGLDSSEPESIGLIAQDLGLSMKKACERLNQTLDKLRGLMESPSLNFTLGV